MNERIVLAGQNISDDYLETLIDEILVLNEDAPLSFFEIMTALAFKAFADNPADVVLLEVGMGGRLDCTNVIPDPLVTIINRISLDHTEFLGETIEAVALEKAGIMKSGVPCVVGYQGDDDSCDEISYTLLSAARKINVSICFCNENYSIMQQKNDFIVDKNGVRYVLPYPSMIGQHQIYNAALAVVALDEIKEKIPVSDLSIGRGVQNACWAGRLQRLSGFDGANEIWLDCGHNDSAGSALAVQARQWQDDDGKPLYLIVGMLCAKDAHGFLEPLLPYVRQIHCVPISFDPAGSKSLGDFLSVNIDVEIISHENVRVAIEKISKVEPYARILIAGSVYLAGEVLEGLSV